MLYVHLIFRSGDVTKLVDTTSEIEPDFIKSSLRDFAQKLKNMERERDESVAKVTVLQRQLNDVESDRRECEERIGTIQKNLQDTEEGTK